ncbi:cation efflux family-domain-containing protein [Dichotomocladium elegans]|nr:cation efflux family-domain-containing protein [Dichotomocladium elegans]
MVIPHEGPEIDECTPLMAKHAGHYQQQCNNNTTCSSDKVTSSTTSCVNITAKNSTCARSPKRKLLLAVSLALLFFVTELVAGYFANSLALVSDAFHLLSDVASFVVALIAIYLAERPATKYHTYGFHRAEVLAAVLSVMTIWVLTAFLVHEAIQRVLHPQEIDAPLMCVTAAIGVVINITLALILGGHHHHHHREEQRHHHDANINLRAATLHVLGDLLASIGVLISSVVLLLKPAYTIVDPICTFVFALIVLYTTFQLIADSISVLMEGAPKHLRPEAIVQSLTAVPGVLAIHDLHVWCLSPGKVSLTVHILVSKDDHIRHDEVLSTSQRIICDEFGVHHSTLQIETELAPFTSHCRPGMCSAGV